MTCTCVTCPECNGNGHVEISTKGYPEWEIDTCPECDGSGVIETCDECLDAQEREEEEE